MFWRRRGWLSIPKVVFSSSAGIFGELKTLPIREDHPGGARFALRGFEAGRRESGSGVREALWD